MSEALINMTDILGQCKGWEPASFGSGLEAGSIHIWLIQMSSEQKTLALETAWAMIPDSEQKRIKRLRVPEIRNNRIGIHGLVYHILSHYLAIPAHKIPIVRTKKGKPRIAPEANKAGLEFNISHSNDIVLLAITVNQPIGIDIEYVDVKRPWNALAKRYYHPDEISALLETSDEMSALNLFYQCWTRKEAYLKAVGSGLDCALRNVFVGLSGVTKIAYANDQNGILGERNFWHIVNIDMPVAYRGALATLFEPDTLCKYFYIHEDNRKET